MNLTGSGVLIAFKNRAKLALGNSKRVNRGYKIGLLESDIRYFYNLSRISHRTPTENFILDVYSSKLQETIGVDLDELIIEGVEVESEWNSGC